MSDLVDVSLSGPLLTGRADSVLDAFQRDAVEQVAQATHQQIHRAEDGTFRNPTGYYRSRTVTELRHDGATVHDSNVIYGNWLEGTSHRNAETRFKGYHNYRKVTQNVRKLAPIMVQRILAGYLRRLGG